jgi:hypothetical protein
VTTAELARIAAGLVPPIGATGVCCMVDDQGKHRAAFIVGQRQKHPAGPAFDRPRDAIAFSRLLEEDAPRSGSRLSRSSDLAVPVAGEPDGRFSEAPDRASPSLPDAGPIEPAPGTCAGCGGPLPPGRRGQRRLTCSVACRQRARYHRAAVVGGADVDSGAQNLTPSRASVADDQVPTSRAAAGGGTALLPASARDAGADPFPEASPPPVPTLGL